MSAPRQKKGHQTRKERMDEAFEKATQGIAKDVNLLIHGSIGGVLNAPSAILGNGKDDNHTDSKLSATAARDTQQLIAALTAQYIHRLVDAALDARDMLLFGDQKMYNSIRQLVPPPAIESLRQPRPPPRLQTSTTKSEKCGATEISYWDQPLPKPRIRGRPDPANVNHDGSVDIGDEWIGALGLDLWQNDCARASYLQHRSISAQHFIFPLCHDNYIYGRIREVQAMKANVTEPLLHDTAVLDMVRTEGRLQRNENARKRKRNRLNSKHSKKSDPQRNTDDDDNEDNDADELDRDETNGPTWPGLNYLLPANRHMK